MVAVGDRAPVFEAIDGPMVMFPCAGEPAPVNPCDPSPEILLTVTGSSGTVNWCGQTWTLPADSGVEKSACPTTYTTRQSTNTSIATTLRAWVASNTWAAGTSNTVLNLGRQYRMLSYLTGGSLKKRSSQNDLYIRVGTGAGFAFNLVSAYFYPAKSTARPVVATGSYVWSSAINLLNGISDQATYSDYIITDAWFGSHTTGGITYAWAKGAGW